MDPKKRRFKVMRIEPEFLIYFLKRKDIILLIDRPLPADTEVYRFHYNAMLDTIDIILWSDQFPDIPEGGQIPIMDPIEFTEYFRKETKTYVI